MVGRRQGEGGLPWRDRDDFRQKELFDDEIILIPFTGQSTMPGGRSSRSSSSSAITANTGGATS